MARSRSEVQAVNLTQSKEEHWKKWIGIYNQKMLSKGTFRDLYVYGYDIPEGYAIEKDGKMYYAFFAPSVAMERRDRTARSSARQIPRYRLRRRQGLGEVEATAGEVAKAQNRIQGSFAAGSESLIRHDRKKENGRTDLLPFSDRSKTSNLNLALLAAVNPALLEFGSRSRTWRLSGLRS